LATVFAMMMALDARMVPTSHSFCSASVLDFLP
jgi:hypothetical protein